MKIYGRTQTAPRGISVLALSVLLVLTLLITAPAAGQQQYSEEQPVSGAKSQPQRSDGANNPNQTGQQQKQSAADQQQWQIEPQGMVRVGYDLNNDGQLDAYRYVSIYELQRSGRQNPDAMRPEDQGGMRQRMESMMPGHQARSDVRDDRAARGYFEESARTGAQQSEPRFDTVEGKVQELRAVGLAEMNERHVIARIRTGDNRIARVDLGPERRITDLNIKKGDRVKVLGMQGAINNQPTLMAHYIVADQQQIAIHRPQDKSIRSYSGQILKTKRASFRDQGQDALMARVRLQNGNTTIVNLGPAEALKNKVDIQEGKTLHMLARPATISGRRALVAEAVSIDNRMVDVNWDEGAPQQTSGTQNQ